MKTIYVLAVIFVMMLLSIALIAISYRCATVLVTSYFWIPLVWAIGFFTWPVEDWFKKNSPFKKK